MDKTWYTLNNRNRTISVVLTIVLLLSLFSLVGSSNNNNNINPDKIMAMDDSGGADPDASGGPTVKTCFESYRINELTNSLYSRGFLYDNYTPYGYFDLIGKKLRPDDGELLEYQEFLTLKAITNSDGLCKHAYNPKLTIANCNTIDLTVALVIDRSSSVAEAGGEDNYKASMKTLIDEFYRRVYPRGGKLNFLIYAFATQSVLQNDNTGTTGVPIIGNNIIMSASTQDEKEALLKVVDNIHFRKENDFKYKNDIDYPNFQYGNKFDGGGAKDKARSYDAGMKTTYGIYGQTNWQDAFVSVMSAQVALNNKIDLAVMVTDGDPSVDNGNDWVFNNTVDFKGENDNTYNDGVTRSDGNAVKAWNDLYKSNPQSDLYRISYVSTSRSYGVQATDAIRLGAAGAKIPYIPSDRKAIPIRGILISPELVLDSLEQRQLDIAKNNPALTQAQRDEARRKSDRSYQLQLTMKHVFRESFSTSSTNPADKYYYFAKDFNTELEKQIKQMVTDIFKAGDCNLNDPVVPALSITETSNIKEVKVDEGTTKDVVIRIQNATSLPNGKGNADLKNVYVCVSSSTPISRNDECIAGAYINYSSLSSGVFKEFSYPIRIDWGKADKEYDLYFTVTGESTADEASLIAGGGTRYPVSVAYKIHVIPIPASLPA